MPKYKLEPDENLFQFAARYGISMNIIWNHPENAELVRKFKSPWIVGPREEIFVPEGEKDQRLVSSGKMGEFKKNPPPDIIEVHLGFMDEEVNARLAKLIDREVNAAKPRPVILIERGKLESTNPILEWRLGNYPVGDKDSPIRKIIQVTGQEDPMVLKEGKIAKGDLLDTEISADPEDLLARAIRLYMQQMIPEERALKAKEIIVCRNCGLSRSALDDVCGNCGISSAMITCKTCGISKPAWSFEGQGCVGGKPHIWIETAKCSAAAGHSWKKPENYDNEKVCSASNALGNRHKWVRQIGVDFGRVFDLVELIKHRSPGSSKSKIPENEAGIGKGPWLSLVRFDIGPEKYEKAEDILPPVIVIRTPEMGLQPSLMKPYIEFLFKAISLMSSQLAAEKAEKLELIDKDVTKATGLPWNIWEWPLRIFQFGAQGSCSSQEDCKPGKIVTVIASLFVGNDIDKEGEAWAVVSLCTPAGVYDFFRRKISFGNDLADLESYIGPNVKIVEWKRQLTQMPVSRGNKITVAQEIAAEIFRTQVNENRWSKLVLNSGDIYRDSNSPYEALETQITPNTTLKRTLEIIYEQYKEKYSGGAAVPVVSLTVPYFGGAEDKNAADALGIYSVGMEDYHVLRVLRSAFCQGISEKTDYPIVLGWRIDRVQCDPKNIEKTLIEKINDYIKRLDEGADGEPTALLTAEEYADIIIWGLKGLITSTRPVCADWNFISYYWAKGGDTWRKRLLTHFWSFSYSGGEDGFTIPNPLYIEIATDFLKELSEMKPGIAGVKNEEIRNEVIKLTKAVLNTWSDEGANRPGFQRTHGRIVQEQPLKVEEKGYYGPGGDLTKLRIVELMNYIAKNCGFDSGRTKGGKALLKTWLRPGKWGTYQNPIKEPTTQDMTDHSSPEFDGACVDRAFYKSCNMMALQTMAGNLWEAI